MTFRGPLAGKTRRAYPLTIRSVDRRSGYGWLCRGLLIADLQSASCSANSIRPYRRVSLDVAMNTVRTGPSVGDEVEESADGQTVMCSACRHPQQAHDATAARYCAATMQMGLSRRCICRGEVVNAGQRPNSVHRFP